MDTPPPPTSADDLFSEDESPQGFPFVAILIAVGAALVGAVLTWTLTVHVLRAQPVPILVPGLVVGLAVRFLAGGVKGNGVWLIMMIALAGSAAGFWWGDYELFGPYSAANPYNPQFVLQRMLSLIGILAFSASAYLAFRISLK